MELSRGAILHNSSHGLYTYTIKRRKFQWKTALQGEVWSITEVLLAGMTPLTLSGLFQIDCGHPALRHSKDYIGYFACFTADFQKDARVFPDFSLFSDILDSHWCPFI